MWNKGKKAPEMISGGRSTSGPNLLLAFFTRHPLEIDLTLSVLRHIQKWNNLYAAGVQDDQPSLVLLPGTRVYLTSPLGQETTGE